MPPTLTLAPPSAKINEATGSREHGPQGVYLLAKMSAGAFSSSSSSYRSAAAGIHREVRAARGHQRLQLQRWWSGRPSDAQGRDVQHSQQHHVLAEASPRTFQLTQAITIHSAVASLGAAEEPWA